MSYVIVGLWLVVLIVGVCKKIPLYDCFCKGIADTLQFMKGLLPCLGAVFMMCQLMEASRLADGLVALLTPILGKVGIPAELGKLILIKPFSGSGSLAYLTELLASQGVDSYVGRCACVVYGSSETVFYLTAVYFAGLKRKNLTFCIVVVLLASFISTIFGCFICKII